MKYSVKKLKEIRDRYMYSFEFVPCGFLMGQGYVLLSRPFLKTPSNLPNRLESKMVTRDYYKKIFLGE